MLSNSFLTVFSTAGRSALEDCKNETQVLTKFESSVGLGDEDSIPSNFLDDLDEWFARKKECSSLPLQNCLLQGQQDLTTVFSASPPVSNIAFKDVPGVSVPDCIPMANPYICPAVIGQFKNTCPSLLPNHVLPTGPGQSCAVSVPPLHGTIFSSMSATAVSTSSELTPDQHEQLLRNKSKALSICLKKVKAENIRLSIEVEEGRHAHTEVGRLKAKLEEESCIRMTEQDHYEERLSAMKSTINNMQAEIEFFRKRFYNC